MSMTSEKLTGKKVGFVALKSLGILVIYALLHFIFDWLPYVPFAIIGGTDESMFQHIKIGFYSFAFYYLIEFLVSFKKLENKEAYWFSRLLSMIIVPWINVILWLSIPVFVEFHGIVELLYSIVIVYVVGFLVLLLNHSTEKIEYGLASKIIIGVLIVLSIFFFTAYTFIEPWYDVFYSENIPPL